MGLRRTIRPEYSQSMRKFATVFAFALATLVTAGGASAAGVSTDYRIHSGDTLSVSVFGEATLSQPSLRVLPGGNISMPLAGTISVAGLTPSAASNVIARALSRYLRYPKVTVAVVTPATLDVLVLGNVKTPGKYSLQSESRLTDAIAAAGGLGVTDGPLPNARLQTADGHVVEISLQRLLQQGEAALNEPVQNEMTIYVISPLPVTVQVWGAVDHPGDVSIKEGDRLVQAIARAGPSPNQNPDLNNIQVRRLLLDGSSRTFTVNLYDILKSGNAGRDPVMEKGDVVYVPQAKKKTDFLGPLTTLLLFLPKPL
jgi:polysaccharide biosynthesis/export protein